MQKKAATLLDLELEDPTSEHIFLSWWEAARTLLEERFSGAARDLIVLGRGRYLAIIEFPLPGAWAGVEADPHWQELERSRPEAALEIGEGRIWQTAHSPRDLSTAELSEWITARAAGELDFVLIDARDEKSFERRHLPGAISLPLEDVESRANGIVGTDRRERVVVYCSGYA